MRNRIHRASIIVAVAVVVVCATIASSILAYQKHRAQNIRELGVRHAEPGATRSNPAIACLLATDVTKDGKSFRVIHVDLPSADFRLFWKRGDGTRFGSFRSLDAHLRGNGHKLLFAANAGIFDPSGTPCGLHVGEGSYRTPLNLRDGEGNFFLKPNGVFFVDNAGARIIESTKFDENTHGVRMASQSGPLLLIDGKINSAFHPESSNRRIRSGVGTHSASSVRFVISNQPVTFYEFADIFRDELDCNNALYLDGVISKFYLPQVDARFDAESDFAGIFAVVESKHGP